MNDVKQVGGDHYEAEYQHWDYVVDMEMPYLPATATKYIARWRKKNGLQDLEKALSYFQKMLALFDKQPKADPSYRHRVHTDQFLIANGLKGLDAQIIICMSGTRDKAMIGMAIDYTEKLILDERRRLGAEHRDMAGGA